MPAVRDPAPLTVGLTSDEARARLAADGPNVLAQAARVGLASRLARELREPMALLLIVAATLSGVLLGEAIDAAAIIVIVLLNAVVALVQEGRAARALDALHDLDTPTATVVRDGRRMVIDAAEVVVGDLVVVGSGDRVPADLDLTDGHGVETDESVLTGESLPVAKEVGGPADATVAVADRSGRLHRGTLVTRGVGSGVVVATGAETAMGAIATSLRELEREPTPLQRELTGLTRRLGLAAVVVASVTFALVLLTGQDGSLEDAFLTAVALAVAAVPEGLAAVTTVALALGVGRMAARGAIVRRLPAVETLGAIDVLVIDKTGTVTQNRMAVAQVVLSDGTVLAPEDVAGTGELAVTLALCSDATTDPPTGAATEMALLGLVSDVDVIRAAAPRHAVAPFTSDRKRMSTVNDGPDGRVLHLKGAPEVVVPLCTLRLDPTGGEVALEPAARESLLARAEAAAGRGERVLALARRELNIAMDRIEEVEAAEEDLTLLALVTLRDPPRDTAAASVRNVREAGVRLVMATGDHPATGEAIAREIGLPVRDRRSGADLRREGLPADLDGVDLYARVEPGHKLALVEALQQRGHIVAMTGDGVNDAPALRRADIGVALGESGSDVAREAADLVITDDDLGTIVTAVREGRGIDDNLRKVVDYLVTSNLAEVMVVVGTLLVLPGFGVPLFPLQLLWVNLLTDGLPALALGVDPVGEDVLRRPPRRRAGRLLDAAHLRLLSGRAAVLAVGGIGAVALASGVLGMTTPQARTVLFSTLVLAQVLLAFVVRGSRGRAAGFNRWLVASAVGSVGLQLLIVLWPPAQQVFDTTVPTVEGWLLVAAIGVAAPLLLGLRRALADRAR